MKIEKLVELVSQRQVDSTQIYRDPSNLIQWFIMIRTVDSATHVLVDDNELPITRRDIEVLIGILKQVGLKSAEVFF